MVCKRRKKIKLDLQWNNDEMKDVQVSSSWNCVKNTSKVTVGTIKITLGENSWKQKLFSS